MSRGEIQITRLTTNAIHQDDKVQAQQRLKL
jgi:hypothetical protein